MKNRLGKPEFIVRLSESEEAALIELAKDFNKDSYAKTLVAVASNYKSEIKRLTTAKNELLKELGEHKQIIVSLSKENKSLLSKMEKFVSLVDKVADIKSELKIFRNARPATVK